MQHDLSFISIISFVIHCLHKLCKMCEEHRSLRIDKGDFHMICLRYTFFELMSVTRRHILTHNTSNESWDPRLVKDTKDMQIHTRMIEKSR